MFLQYQMDFYPLQLPRRFYLYESFFQWSSLPLPSSPAFVDSTPKITQKCFLGLFRVDFGFLHTWRRSYVLCRLAHDACSEDLTNELHGPLTSKQQTTITNFASRWPDVIPRLFFDTRRHFQPTPQSACMFREVPPVGLIAFVLLFPDIARFEKSNYSPRRSLLVSRGQVPGNQLILLLPLLHSSLCCLLGLISIPARRC